MKTKVQKKRILIIIPSLLGGGAERVLINILQRFNYEKYIVDICVGVKEGIYLSNLPQDVNLKVIFANRFLEKLIIVLHRYLNSRILPKLLLKLKIRNNYDVGISFIDGYYTDFLLTLSDRIKKKITWVHASYGSNDNYRRFYKGNYRTRLINDRYHKLDRIVFVSNDSLSEFTKVFGSFNNTEVIYNYMDIETIRLNAEEKSDEIINNGEINIVAVGNLLPVKAYDKLIMAAKMLRNDQIKFKIRILGTGYLEKKLHKLIKLKGVQDNVELAGFRKNPYPLMKASDIFVMTSKSEALPTALCEAMILGLPCVVTNCLGCREITENGKYGIMTGQSADEIYVGLKSLITDEKLRSEYETRSLQRSTVFNGMKILERIYSLL